MKDKTSGVAIEDFVRLKPDISLKNRKKANGVNKNVVATISHNQYKDAWLNEKCLRYSINRIQSKNHGIRTYEISKIYLSCFDDRVYIIMNGYDGLALGYLS